MKKIGVVLVMGALLGGSGCAAQRMAEMRASVQEKWDARKESHAFTYDAAVVELGPPSAKAELDSGGRVVTWTWNHGSRSVIVPAGNIAVARSYSRVETLELIFDEKGVLSSWIWTYR